MIICFGEIFASTRKLSSTGVISTSGSPALTTPPTVLVCSLLTMESSDSLAFNSVCAFCRKESFCSSTSRSASRIDASTRGIACWVEASWPDPPAIPSQAKIPARDTWKSQREAKCLRRLVFVSIAATGLDCDIARCRSGAVINDNCYLREHCNIQDCNRLDISGIGKIATGIINLKFINQPGAVVRDPHIIVDITA